ncbi:MAG: dihydroneopterin aldolase [Candidatus Omnitrophica bacterium]|nr:dihydroneopterin aldolase [Candidatus Omnitrophota bacterium]
MQDKIFLEALEVRCIIGIFDWERKIRQKVLIDLEIPADIRRAAKTDRIQDALDYKRIAKHTLQFVSKSRFQLIETLAEKLAESLLAHFRIPEIKLRISKPGAIRGSKNVGIEIIRKRLSLSKAGK